MVVPLKPDPNRILAFCGISIAMEKVDESSEKKGVTESIVSVAKNEGEDDASSRMTARKALEGFLSDLDCISTSIIPAVSVLVGIANKSQESLDSYFVELEKKYPNPDDLLSHEDLNEGDKLLKIFKSSNGAISIVPRSFILILISQFDSFIGNMVRAILTKRSHILNSSNNIITYGQLFQFNSIEAAKDYLIDQEVDSVLRGSHAEHFDWLDKKLKTDLRKYMDVWPQFVEITERRNLFAHTDGKVSRQYIDNCNKHGYKFNASPSLNEQLEVDPEYFSEAINCLTEVALKTGHTVWRLLNPEEKDEADKNLQNIVFEMLVAKKDKLVIEISKMALHPVYAKDMDEGNRLYIVINMAIAYKRLNRLQEMNDLLSREKWEFLDDVYKLAHLCLMGDYAKASNLMVKCGNNDDLKEDGFKTWPIFDEFRDTQLFKDAFKAIFHKEYEPLQEVPIKNLHDIVSEIKSSEKYLP